MKKALIVLSAAFILLAGTGCDKDDDCDLNSSNLAGTYKITSVVYKLNASTPEENVTGDVFEACELDDLHIFNSNGTYAYQVAGVACTPEAAEYTSAWSLAGTTLTLDGDPATVSSFSCDEFSATTTDFDVAGDRLTYNFKKQ